MAEIWYRTIRGSFWLEAVKVERYTKSTVWVYYAFGVVQRKRDGKTGFTYHPSRESAIDHMRQEQMDRISSYEEKIEECRRMLDRLDEIEKTNFVTKSALLTERLDSED